MIISAPHSGKVSSLSIREGDSLESGELVCKIMK